MEQQLPKPKYLELRPEDVEKIRQRKEREDKRLKIDDEMILVAEFGMYYGYAAVEAVNNDEITLDRMLWLIMAARKVDARNQHNLASAVFTAVASANSKKPAQAFKANTKSYLKQMKADA